MRNSEGSLQSALNTASIWDRVSKFRDQRHRVRCRKGGKAVCVGGEWGGVQRGQICDENPVTKACVNQRQTKALNYFPSKICNFSLFSFPFKGSKMFYKQKPKKCMYAGSYKIGCLVCTYKNKYLKMELTDTVN